MFVHAKCLPLGGVLKCDLSDWIRASFGRKSEKIQLMSN